MEFTTADLALTDNQRAEAHSQKTGYDYNANSDAIDGIHAVVSLNHQEADSSPRKNAMDETIMPTASTRYQIGVNIYTFKQEDIAAYSEKYPQNAAAPSDRIRILEKMRAGNTTLASTPSTSNTNNPVVFPRFPEVSSYDFATKAASASGRIFLYSSPSHANSVGVIEQNGLRAKMVDYKIDQPSGNNLWHYVLFENPYVDDNGNTVSSPVYIYHTDLENTSGKGEAEKERNAQGSRPSGSTPADFRAQQLDIPYDENFNLTTRVVVEIQPQATPINDQQVLEAGFYKGIKIILKENGKKHDEAYIRQALVDINTVDRPAQAIEWYADTSRPGSSSVKVLVQIKKANLDALQNTLGGPEQYVHQVSYSVQEMGTLLSQVSSEIGKLKKPISSYEGKIVLPFDADRESSELLNVITHVKKLLDDNDIDAFSAPQPPTQGGPDFYLNFRATADYSAVSVHYVKRSVDGTERSRVVAVKGFEKYKKQSPIESKRTQKLFFNLRQIKSDFSKGMQFEKFLTSYIDYDKVKLIPKTKDAVQEAEPKAIAAKVGPTIKTLDDLKKEDVHVKDPGVIAKKAEARARQTEKTKGGLFAQFDFKKTRDQIPTTSDEMYEYYLNNIHIKQMMLNALECLVNGQIGQNFDDIVNDIKVLKKDVFDPVYDYGKGVSDEFKKKGFKESAKKAFEPLTMLFPDSLPVDDMSAAFVKVLKKQLARIINQIIFQLLKNTIDTFINFCEKDSPYKIPDPTDIPGLAFVPDFVGLQNMIDDLFDYDVPPSRILDLVTDLCNLLSARELCDLLKGNPSSETLRIVRGLLDAKYCELGLDSDGKVIDFFTEIGKSMDLSLCEELVGTAPDEKFADDDLICPPDSELRDRLLHDAGLTPDQIQRQLDLERQMAEKLARQMIDSIKNGTIQAPNPFCTRDAQGNVQPGHTSFMDAQLAYTMRTTFEKTFENPYVSFNREGNEFAEALMGTREMYLFNITQVRKDDERKEKNAVPFRNIVNREYVRENYTTQNEIGNTVILNPVTRLGARNDPGFPASTDPEIYDYYSIPGDQSYGLQTLQRTDVRAPLPHLVDWYRSPTINAYRSSPREPANSAGISRLRDDLGGYRQEVSNHVELSVPYNFGSSFEFILGQIKEASLQGSRGGCSDEEAEKLQRLQSVVDAASEAQSALQSANKIEIIETTPCVYDYYNKKKGSQLQSTTFQQWDEQRRQPETNVQEQPAVLGNPQLDPCEDPIVEVSPPPPLPPEPESNSQNEQPDELTPLEEYRRCKQSEPAEDSIAYLFFIKENMLKQKMPVKDEYLEWLGQRDGNNKFLSGILFFKEMVRRNLLLAQAPGYMSQDAGNGIMGFIETLFDDLQVSAINQVAKNIDYDDYVRQDFYNSPLLKRATSGDYFDQGDNPEYSSEEAFLLELVSFGRIPDQRQKCDTHLLRIKDLINEELANFQKDLCLDLEAESANSTPGRPRLTPIEESLLRVCIKTTVRHYIAETISTGLLSYSFGSISRRGLTNMQSEYVLEKMKQKMIAYSAEYYDEFIIQAYEIYDGDKEDKSYTEVMSKIIKKEYTEIAEGIYESVASVVGRDRMGNFGNVVGNFTASIPYFEAVPVRSVFSRDERTAEGRSLRSFFRAIAGLQGRLSNDNIFDKLATGEIKSTLAYETYNENMSRLVMLVVDENAIFTESTIETFDEAVVETSDLDMNTPEGINEYQQRLNRINQGQFPFNHDSGIFGGAAYKRITLNKGLESVSCYSIPLIEGVNATPLPSPFNKVEYNILIDLCLPLRVYSSAAAIHEMETTSAMTSVALSFAETRASLFVSFQAVMPKKDDWDKGISFLEEQGGDPEYTAKFDFNNQLYDVPCTEISYNFGLDVCWGQSFDGLGFDFAVKAAAEAALNIMKSYIELNDPNIKIAKALSFLSKLACVNIPTSAYSAVINWTHPWITTPLTWAYNGIGLGRFAKMVSGWFDDDDDDENTTEAIEFQYPVCEDIEVRRLPEEIEEEIIEQRNLLVRAKQDFDELINEVVGGNNSEEVSSSMESKAKEIQLIETKLDNLQKELQDSNEQRESSRD